MRGVVRDKVDGFTDKLEARETYSSLLHVSAQGGAGGARHVGSASLREEAEDREHAALLAHSKRLGSVLGKYALQQHLGLARETARAYTSALQP